jgi:transcriptional regulator with XRE-family HTH domain
MYKNKAENGCNNLCGARVRAYREKLPNRTSQKMLADMLQMEGLDIDKNAIQRIESGQRFVTDIELKKLAQVLNVTYQDLLE